MVIGGAEPLEGSIEEPLAVLAELKNRALIRDLGVSNITPNQLIEAQKITNIVCVQNFYNVANRNDDEFIDQLAKQGIPYVPFFPLGGFTPLQSSVLDAAAASLQAAPMQIALLAWLLQRSSNILPIPGTLLPSHPFVKISQLQRWNFRRMQSLNWTELREGVRLRILRRTKNRVIDE